MTPESLESLGQTLGQIGRVLWLEPGEAAPKALEAFTDVSLPGPKRGEVLESAISHMLKRANRMANATNRITEVRQAPAGFKAFFGLLPQERLLLALLHREQWSYVRIGALLGMSGDEVEEAAWKARVELGLQLGASWPVASSLSTLSCPEYNARQPWTQRFLDEEFRSGTERVFFQNHLLGCDSCRRALSSCRDLYYTVDRAIPRVDPADQEIRLLAESMERISRESEALGTPSMPRAEGTLLSFFGRWDVALAFVSLLWLIAHAMRRH